MRARTWWLRSAGDWPKTATSRARTWRSSTDGRSANTTDCRRSWPTSSAVASPLSLRLANLLRLRPKPRPPRFRSSSALARTRSSLVSSQVSTGQAARTIHTSRQYCYQGRRSANIHASSGVIRGKSPFSGAAYADERAILARVDTIAIVCLLDQDLERRCTRERFFGSALVFHLR